MVIMERYIPMKHEYDRRRQEHAAIIIQSIIRRFLAVRLLERMKLERQRRQEQAAITIQGQVRKFLAIRLANQLRFERQLIDQLKQKHAATVIQRFYRTQRQKKYERAAVVLQSHIRKFLAQRMVERMKVECYGAGTKEQQEERRFKEERAAVVIQRQIRKFLAIRKVDHLRAQKAVRQFQERHAAIVIQRFYRTHRNEKFEHAAVVLQSHVRRFLAVRRYKRIKSVDLTTQHSVDGQENRVPTSEIVEDRLSDNQKLEQNDDRLNEMCDRLMQQTNAAAKLADSVGPLSKSTHNKQVFDDSTAALIIQRSWRGYTTRREQAELVKRLKKIRSTWHNSPSTTNNPREHRNFSIKHRMDLYLPLLTSANSRDQLLAAAFMNRITKNPQFADDFIERGGTSMLIKAASKLTRNYEDTSILQELTPLLWTCLQRPSMKSEANKHIDQLLEILVNNIKCFKKNELIMTATCNSIFQLAKNPSAPSILKRLQFPFHVAQSHRQYGPKTKASLLSALKKADEVIRSIDMLPEHNS
ncbi:hypothetical protein M3Y94_00983300 [Aphelenchoides besseyi]|nr:hypothetical protein M3Y94_00983300 [Aphelenchoides besseyi]KAI6221079.1 hypothetical protein M3Y95_01003000 [Aphelenchoides besseyi]